MEMLAKAKQKRKVRLHIQRLHKQLLYWLRKKRQQCLGEVLSVKIYVMRFILWDLCYEQNNKICGEKNLLDLSIFMFRIPGMKWVLFLWQQCFFAWLLTTDISSLPSKCCESTELQKTVRGSFHRENSTFWMTYVLSCWCNYRITSATNLSISNGFFKY